MTQYYSLYISALIVLLFIETCIIEFVIRNEPMILVVCIMSLIPMMVVYYYQYKHVKELMFIKLLNNCEDKPKIIKAQPGNPFGAITFYRYEIANDT
ncbi:MAG: hypothetical protein KAS32_06760 [Candidatus Peribacteraceae bacterium]|nr:hypothetical protein [Candidatus Peribacteraceae bacterium]